MKKGVLYNKQLYVGIEASTTEVACFFGVKAGSFYELEAAVFFNRFGDILNCDTFIFLFHFVYDLDGD